MSGEGGSGTSRRGWRLPLQQEGQESDTWENFLFAAVPLRTYTVGGITKEELFSPPLGVSSCAPRETLGGKVGSWPTSRLPGLAVLKVWQGVCILSAPEDPDAWSKNLWAL